MAVYSNTGRLGGVIVMGAQLKGNIVENVLKGSVVMGTSEATELTLVIREDPDFTILRSGLFYAGTDIGVGSSVVYEDLVLETRAVEIGPRGADHTLTVTARSAGVAALKRRRGAIRPLKNVSPTSYAALAAKAVGLKFVGEVSGKRKTVGRAKGENDWTCLQRLAGQLGFVCFEAAGVLYFGRPTYIIDRTHQFTTAWKGADTDDSIDALPTCRRSGDDPKGLTTVKTSMRGPIAGTIRPGMSQVLTGVPRYEARYMVTGVNIPLADNTAVTIDAATTINPDRQT